ncbi:phage tail assembly protein [Shinella sp. 838]|uniref:phage tail assembly protein n=1 Tax=Shinella sp. 838 TaxID=3038164 RepID=UPI0024152B59|nr:phage tail assembly protein [Shinella sp. 838]MDG4671627.1 phage tail assembly protein [Shinella sp. 838]
MKSYTLKTPVSHNDKTFTTLTFRKPKVGDLMSMDKFEGETGKMIALLASISDTPIQVIKEIDLDDFGAMVSDLGDTLGNFHASTATGSM